MTIGGLNNLPSAPTSGDLIPVERGATTYKATYDSLLGAIGTATIGAAKPIVELGNIDSFTVPANGTYSLTVNHTKTGYTCWFVNYAEYRSGGAWFTHVKEIGYNYAVLDVVNTSGSAITVSTAKAMWLCVPD